MARRVALFSVHTSPLAQPGSGDGGGMNVYVDSIARSLAAAGVTCDVFTRADALDVPQVVEVTPGYRVVKIEAGPLRSVASYAWPGLIDEYTAAARSFILANGSYDVLHANYWVSGAVAHALKHDLDVPLVTTFHTLALVKEQAGFDSEPERELIEASVMRCSDVMLANTIDERDQLVGMYGATPSRIEVLSPGVDHEVFNPHGRVADRSAIGFPGKKIILFAGRIQPLKGADVAVRVVAMLKDPDAHLLLVGGPSGIDGEREMRRLRALVEELDVVGQVSFVPPQSHNALAQYYRAADVCVVPSRTESFGLVALEAAACGTPVVASAVGGLTHIVADGQSGFLVGCCDAANFVEPVRQVLNDPALADELSRGATRLAAMRSWSVAGARLRRLYADLGARELVLCK